MKQFDIESFLQQHNLVPSKSKGQNFLIDDDVLNSIVNAADLKPTDKVLEIGPGLGVLTEQLLDFAEKVLVVELDEKLAKLNKYKFRKNKNFELIQEDILKIKNIEISEKLEGDYKVVANIPYNITSKIIKKFLVYEPLPKEMVILVQKEVAERICAKPGKMSILAVSVQIFSQPEIVEIVPNSAFYPSPKVDSAILRIKNIKKIDFDEKRFFQIVKIGFSARRKKLIKNLSAGLRMEIDKVREIVLELGFSENTRAQELSVEDWKKLAEKI